ncbi:GNAT family N-acetyltransferase [Lunatibacter salilacus]|uniref:GNAT family N-acetyltransferase n=1 Tax=Lunatibacter salilacus TaxID=2483804 RepID=UPI00131E36BA|nr:GNAT family N-acetyltransferase [Lunatibacter salilacus]
MVPEDVKIEINKNPEVSELMELFRQTDWAKNRDPDKIGWMLAKTDMSVCLRQDGKLLAYGRILNDGCFRGLLDDVVVEKSVRGQGFGTLLMKTLIQISEPLEVLFLNADPKMKGYYGKFGFSAFQGITMVRRKKSGG